MTLLKIEEPKTYNPGDTTFFNHPVLRLGFRPFYLLAAAFAAVSVPLWMVRYLGWSEHLANVGLLWHMHEMIFGFVIAVVIGFLYTAGRNWTGLWTPTKRHLAALAGLWVAGRLAMLAGTPAIAALVDFAFLPLATWPMYRVLQRSGNKRNMFVIVLLSLLAIANAIFHASVLGWLSVSPMRPVYAAIMIIVMLESVIAGRVIPGFTANAIPGTKPVTDMRQDRVCMALTGAACLSFIFGAPPMLMAACAVVAACAQLIRLAGWKPYTTLHHPLLWILHLSYAWIPVGFALLALSILNVVSQSAALHVLAIGSMAGLIIGMTTRTALGHTGRRLSVGNSEIAMYLLIQIGAVSRLFAAVQSGVVRDAALLVTTVAWSAAFLLYLYVYGPYLVRARVDNKEG